MKYFFEILLTELVTERIVWQAKLKAHKENNSNIMSAIKFFCDNSLFQTIASSVASFNLHL